MSTQHAQYVLLFLVLVVNSDRFQIYRVTCSYSSWTFVELPDYIMIFKYMVSTQSCNLYINECG